MRFVVRFSCVLVACAALLVLVHPLVAGDQHDGGQVVIYPGDYVIQAGDVDATGSFREGLAPSAVIVYPGERVIQKSDVSTLGRWRIDVDPNSPTATAVRISSDAEAPVMEYSKVEVSPHLNVSLIECEDCGSPISATGTRTIHIAGVFQPVPPATPAASWQNPAIGWPSSPSSSGNVTGVSPGSFVPPGPYVNDDSFDLRFDVSLDPMATFRIYVDVVGDIVEP